MLLVHFVVSSQGTTLDNPQEDTIPSISKQSETLTESHFSMEEQELAKLIHTALMTDLSAMEVAYLDCSPWRVIALKLANARDAAQVHPRNAYTDGILGR